MEFKSVSKSDELLHIGSFLPRWEKVLDDEDMTLHVNELDKSKVAEYLDDSEKVITELEECCDEASLVCPAEKELGDLEHVSLKDGVPVKNVSLETLRVRCITFHRSSGGPSQFYATPKYAKWNHDMEYNHLETGLQTDDSTVGLRATKVLLQVSLWKAFRGYAGQTSEAWKARDLWKEREILILSDQKLTELRDKIHCAADMAWVSADISENPDAELTERAKDVYPSNFFVIENIFYPDLRHPLATDISSPLQDWLKTRNKKVTSIPVDDIRVKPMTEVTLNDLYVKLGYPYLYCHQGNCEHLVVFSDIRLVHGDDCQDATMYPMLINKPLKKRLLCMICKTFCSKWMTRNDSFTPSDPTFQCDTCFRLLHYDEHGKKLGNFEAYPYIDPGIYG